MYKTTATVQVKDSQGKVIAKQDYEKQVFEGMSADDKGKPTGGTPEELLGQTIKFFQDQVGKDGNGVLEMLENVTYSYDLKVRAQVRQSLVAAAAGPDKAIEKAIKDYVAARSAMGNPISVDAARQLLFPAPLTA